MAEEAASTNLAPTESSNWHELVSPSPLNGVIIFLVSTLGFFLQVEYQSRKISPFEEHSIIKWEFYLTLSIYATGLMAEIELQACKFNYYLIVKRFTLLFGAFLVVLLLIILLPLFGWITSIFWAVSMLVAVLKSYQQIFQCFKQIFSKATEIIRSFFERVQNHPPGDDQNGLSGREDNCISENEKNGLVQREESDLPTYEIQLAL